MQTPSTDNCSHWVPGGLEYPQQEGFPWVLMEGEPSIKGIMTAGVARVVDQVSNAGC